MRLMKEHSLPVSIFRFNATRSPTHNLLLARRALYSLCYTAVYNNYSIKGIIDWLIRVLCCLDSISAISWQRDKNQLLKSYDVQMKYGSICGNIDGEQLVNMNWDKLREKVRPAEENTSKKSKYWPSSPGTGSGRKDNESKSGTRGGCRAVQ
jgi:hypothetical protein